MLPMNLMNIQDNEQQQKAEQISLEVFLEMISQERVN